MNTRDDSFSSKLFELIDTANLEQLEKLKASYPEHVKVYEDAVQAQRLNSSHYHWQRGLLKIKVDVREQEFLNLSIHSPLNNKK
jgi:hypothetical protein